MIRHSLFAVGIALLLTSCSKNIDTTEAVRQGIMDYMSTIAPKIGLDLNSMQVDVVAVSFEHDHARASVTITPKMAGSKGMDLVYNLDRKGAKWVVNGSAMGGGSNHGQQGAPPAAAAPSGESAPGGTQLPPGHPAVGAAPGGTQLPPGHPAVGSKQ